MTSPLFRLVPPAAALRPGRRLLALLLLGGALAAPPVLAAPAEPARKAATPKAPAKPAAKKPAPRKPAAKAPSTRRKTPPSQRDLDRLQAEIRNTEKRIRLTREQREQKEAELRQAELEIGSLKESMGTVQKDVRSREERLRALQAEKQQRELDKARLVNQIRADLQMAQRQGGEDYYKLLLNQEDPQTLARLMKYYAYLQQARAGRVQALNENLARLEVLQREEEEQVARLRDLRGDLQQKQSRLSVAQQQRSQAIRTLSAQLESEDERLQRLRRDEQALQAVMERLARESAEREQRAREQREAEKRRQQAAPPAGEQRQAEGRRPPPPVAEPEPRDFKAMPYKGRCPLPAAGGVRARFGSARSGGLRWNGVLIDAPAGAAVRAIRPGRVAFADYLRGYGFLVIVDHGRGLMSLYGQNQALHKKAGENVAANEVVATVGDGAGNDSAGLYFEIRVRGRPSDPAEWCAYQ